MNVGDSVRIVSLSSGSSGFTAVVVKIHPDNPRMVDCVVNDSPLGDEPVAFSKAELAVYNEGPEA